LSRPHILATVGSPVTSRRRSHRSLLAAAATLLASAALVGPAAASTTKNGNFVGTWTVSNGEGFTITSEDSATGACVGTSALAGDGYGLIDCQVTGHRYTFTITYGTSYQSVNTGWFFGPWLGGKFSDTNGTTERYHATRPLTFSSL
jgi:hypothetical protein